MVSGADSGFPQVSFGQPDEGGQPGNGGQAPGGEQPGYGSGYQQPAGAGPEVPPATWLPTPPPSSSPPGGGYGGGPQWGPDYGPGYGTGPGPGYGGQRPGPGPASGYGAGYGPSGYGPGFGPDPNMGPARNVMAYAAMRWRMRRGRRRRLGCIAFLAVWVIAGIIIGVVNSGNSGGSGDASSWNPPTGVVTGTTGTALTLYGFESGEKMSVTLTKVVLDAQPGNQFDAPKPGNRLYAAQFRLTDSGTAAYSDSPSNGAQVLDSAGQSYSSDLVVYSPPGCPTFSVDENIAVGGSRLGCIVFEVPANAKITAVEFTLDSGLAQQTGQWKVAG